MGGALGAKLFLMRLGPMLDDRRVSLQPRNPKTKSFMVDRGLRSEDLLSFLKTLTEKDYDSGPDDDRDNPVNPGSVMVFLPKWGREILYVKLKVWSDGQTDYGEIMSFHLEGTY